MIGQISRPYSPARPAKILSASNPNFFSSQNESICVEILREKFFDSDKSLIFCAPTKFRKSLQNTAIFCTTESEENGSSSFCDVYPGGSHISRPLISLRMMQNIFQKCGETPSTGAIARLLQQYPRFKEKYTD